MNLGRCAVEGSVGYQGIREVGDQCQVWEKMTKISTLHSPASFIYLRFEGLPKKLWWVFADLVRKQAYGKCSLFLFLCYLR